jgi:hypothetical protein
MFCSGLVSCLEEEAWLFCCSADGLFWVAFIEQALERCKRQGSSAEGKKARMF